MRKLMNGVLIGFGSALSIVVSTAWVLLSLVLELRYLVVAEAKVIGAASIDRLFFANLQKLKIY